MVMTVGPATGVRVPVDWWEAFEPPPGARAEVIRGVFTLSPSPNPLHGLVQSQLLYAFKENMPAGLVALQGIEWMLAKGGIVAIAPQPDVMVGRWAERSATMIMPPVLAVEVLSPSDTAPWEGMTRIIGKRLDYAANDLEHYLEVDTTEPSIARYELHDGELAVVEQVSGDGVLTAAEPFPYSLQPSALIRP